MANRGSNSYLSVTEGGASAESMLAAVLEAAPGYVFGCDAEGRCVLMNGALRSILDEGAPMDSRALLPSHPSSPSADSVAFQESLRTKTGLLPVRVNGRRVATCPGLSWLYFLQPAADSSPMSEHVTQAQKLEAIGQLAAGIAHEINTPTQYVGDNTRFLKDAFESIAKCREPYQGLLAAAKAGSVAPEIVDEVERVATSVDLEFLMAEVPMAIEQSLEGLDQIARIVRAMKEFSHPGMGEKTFVDVNAAIENTIMVSKNEWKYVADLVKNFDPNLPLVPCLPGAFNQVLLNLIVNAAHAIEDANADRPGHKGTITIETRSVGDAVEVSIGDTGVGIPDHIRSRVYDPFFTTKEVGRGTGQGLALTYSIVVEKHGGTISFVSEPGEGTTFVLRLPANVSPQEACA